MTLRLRDAALVVAATAILIQPVTATPSIQAMYAYSNEYQYRLIQLDGSNITIVYNRHNSAVPRPSSRPPLAQVPYWTRADLITLRKTLPPPEVQSLAVLIRQTHLLNLRGTYGHGFGYAETIQVALDGKKKKIVCNNHPCPVAFRLVASRLTQMIASAITPTRKP